jgi:peptidoglycan biosynthesis protein MviN/MurJ (putative lipid II flippase)
MSILALWYYHSPEGLRFLEAREIRVILAAAGILAAYILLRTRHRFSPRQSWSWTVGRCIMAGAIATALWFGVDWLRDEDWIFQLLGALPGLHENGVRYLVLITAGWLGWSIALFEGLRRITIVRQRYRAEVPASP